jgi:type I site-specific restriction endonuclease
MSVNLTHPELLETASRELPVASLETLKTLRDEMCSSSASRDFKLQSHQRFLRRVLSPDSSTRSLLMVHGTGTGKTCSAIQIAEEYILRPEFQDQRVLVLAQPAVQENFKNQIFFTISRKKKKKQNHFNCNLENLNALKKIHLKLKKKYKKFLIFYLAGNSRVRYERKDI